MTTKAGSSQFTFFNYQITGYKHVLFLGVHWQSLVPLLLTHTHSFTHSPISLYIDHLLTTFTVLIRQCTNTATTTTTITVHNSHCIQTIFSTLSAAFLLVRGGLPALTTPKWLPGVFLLILLLLLIEPFSYQTRNYYNNNNSNNLGNGRHQGKADRHNAGSCRLLLLLLLLSPDFT